jgi:hypothetical protein
MPGVYSLIACVTLAGTMGLVVSEEPTTYRPGPADALDMIRGLGTLLAAVGLLPIGPLQAAYGWGSVWLYLVANLVVTIVLLSLEICVEHLRGTTRTRDNGENNPGTYAELSAFDAINDSAE